MQRRHFTDEFKREAVKLARQPEANTAAIARDLGIGANLLGRWMREQEGQSGSVTVGKSESGAVSPEEFERMRRELAKVKMERDILKKARVSSTDRRNTIWFNVDWEDCFYGANGASRIVHCSESGTMA